MSTRYIARAMDVEWKRGNRTNKFTSEKCTSEKKKCHKWSWKLLLSDNDIYGLNIKSFEMLRIIIYYFSLLKSFHYSLLQKLWEKGTYFFHTVKWVNKKLWLTLSIFNSKVKGREKVFFSSLSRRNFSFILVCIVKSKKMKKKKSCSINCLLAQKRRIMEKIAQEKRQQNEELANKFPPISVHNITLQRST